MSLHSPWRSCHGDGERLDFGGRVEASTLVSGEPEGGSLLAPIQGQTRVGHQLVGGQSGGLLSRQDRRDDVRGEESQPHQTRCICGRDSLLGGDVFTGGPLR